MLTETAHECFPGGFAHKKAHAAYTHSEAFFSPRLERLRAFVEAISIPNLDRPNLFSLDLDPSHTEVVVTAQSGSRFVFYPDHDWNGVEISIDDGSRTNFNIHEQDREIYLIDVFTEWAAGTCPSQGEDFWALLSYACRETEKAAIHASMEKLHVPGLR